MDLQKLRERIKEYRNRIGVSQEELADGIYVHKSVLSEALNGKRPISTDLIHRIIHYLAERGALRGRSQVFELIKLTDSEDFSEADWKSPPLADLVPEPPVVPSHQIPLNEALSVASNDDLTSAHGPEWEDLDDEAQKNVSAQTGDRTAAVAETPEEQEQPRGQIGEDLGITLIQSSGLPNLPLSQKDKLEDAYRQLMTISEARFQFAGVVEALRKFGGEVAHEALPQAKSELEDAERTFHEKEVRQTITLLDNDKIWPHYVMGTEAFKKHKERTKDLVEEVLEPRSLLTRPVLNLEALLAGDRWKDYDPQTGKLYLEMEKEFNAMLRAMNRRLKL